MTSTLPAATHIGSVNLYTADKSRSLDFYRDQLGFGEIGRDGDLTVLSANGETPHILLTEHKGAQPKPRRTTGLYHVAIRYPSRNALARAFRRLALAQYPFGGFSDHAVSEALYLDDPDGNGLEMYVDRPRDQWPMAGGGVAMVTEPLDLDDLLAQADDSTWVGTDPDTDIGHVHLHVSDLNVARHFYVGLIGLEVMQDMGIHGALFVAAGGYHHHLGLNIWAGKARQPANTLGIKDFEIVIPEAEGWDAAVGRLRAADVTVEIDGGRALLQDVDGNHIVLVNET